MKNKTENKKNLQPKLRFKEFVSDGNLENEKIGNLCKITTGKLDANAMVENGQYRFYTCAKDYYFIDKYAFDTEALLISGNGANVGYIHYYKGKFNAYQRTYVLDQFTQDIFFIKYYLERNLSKRIATEKKDGNTPYIVLSSISEMAVMLPKDKKEQQKIADCLSSLDELIDAEDKKLEALQRHKKGLMQELFPAEGQTLPKLRFPEFASDGEWEESNIGSLGNFYYGKSAPKWSLEKNAPTPCVRYGELYTKYGPIITKTYSRTNIKTTELKFSKGGEILIPRVGEKPEDFGKNCCYLPLKNIAIGEMISVFETQQNPLFYTYYFRSIYKEFAKVVEGQNVKNLYYAELEPLTVFRPLLPEQQKIADFLSSIDNLITAQNKKLESLRLHKKGLMQQLFPNPDN